MDSLGLIILSTLLLLDWFFLHYFWYGYQDGYEHIVVKIFDWVSKKIQKQPLNSARNSSITQPENEIYQKLPESGSMNLYAGMSDEAVLRERNRLNENRRMNEEYEYRKYVKPLKIIKAWRKKVQTFGFLLLLAHIIAILFLVFFKDDAVISIE